MDERTIQSDAVEVFKIEVGGKYLVVVEVGEEQSDSKRDAIYKSLEFIKEELDEWLKGDDTFFMLVLAGGAKFKLEKVEK